MKNKFLFLIAMFCLLVSVSKAVTIHQWEVFSISFKSGKIYSNPYKDIPAKGEGDLLKVTFIGTAGDALNKQITVTGFWNGGSEWRVNFTPPLTGTWKYSSVSADRGMNGKKGNS